MNLKSKSVMAKSKSITAKKAVKTKSVKPIDIKLKGVKTALTMENRLYDAIPSFQTLFCKHKSKIKGDWQKAWANEVTLALREVLGEKK